MSATEIEINELARSLNRSDSILATPNGIVGANKINHPVYFEVADNIISLLPTERLVLARLAGLYWQSGVEAKFVAGVPRGMDAIVSSLKHILDLGQLKVNPDIKDHGTKKAIDGVGFVEGDKVAVFEDVCVTGKSTISKCILPLQNAGLEVTGCFVLINRPFGGIARIQEETGVPVWAYCQDLELLNSVVRQELFKEKVDQLEIIKAEIARQKALEKN